MYSFVQSTVWAYISLGVYDYNPISSEAPKVQVEAVGGPEQGRSKAGTAQEQKKERRSRAEAGERFE